jgi:hypothetical protein
MSQYNFKDLWARLRPVLGIASLWGKLHSMLLLMFEMVPLMLFLVAKSYDFGMPKRIFIGGGAAILVFCLYAIWKNVIKFTPLNLGVNLFFVWASIILILPLPSLHIFFLELGEVGMYTTVLIVFVWQHLNPRGLTPSAQEQTDNQKYSWVLLGICALCLVVAHYFKGNENLAGALPYMIILFSDMVLNYFKSREMKRNLEYVS